MTEHDESPQPIAPGTLLAGRFRVVRRLGFGGMGSVYAVEHEITKHRRALKLMHPDFARRAEHVARFLREASAAGRIGNPHIAETFDAGKLESGEPYIVMELLEGQPLSDLIEARGQLGFAEAISFTLQAAEGVEAAHAAGIVHRDLKPENVFVCSGRVPFVKILDFGISKFDPEKTGDSRLTVDGTTMGTPTHMSPEQIRGQSDIDARTDVYALGLVLYESVTGRKAYFAETLTQLAVMIHEGRYAPVSQFRSDVPPGFEAVIARALDANRDTRYQTVREFMAALESFVDLSTVPHLTGADAIGVRTATAPAAFLAQPLAGGAATDAGVENSRPGTPAPSNKAARNTFVAVTATAVVLAVAGAVVWARFLAPSATPSLAAGSKAVPEPPAPAKPKPVMSVVPAAERPRASDPVTGPAPGETPAPVASAASRQPSGSPVQLSKPAAAAAASAAPIEKSKPTKTRAGDRGLAEENPF